MNCRYSISIITGLLLAGLVYAGDYEALQDYVQQKKYAEARQLAGPLLAGDKPPLQIGFLVAQMEVQAGQPASAITLYEKLIQAYPEQAELYNNLAVIFASQGELARAQQTLEQGMQTQAEYAVLYKNLNLVYLARANSSYSKAINLTDTPETVGLVVLNELSLPEPEHTKVSPASHQVQAESVDNKNKAETVQQAAFAMLESWAQAWAAQKVDEYLGFYAESFQPPRGLSRPAWQRERRQRLTRPAWIKVELTDMKELHSSPERVIVELVQGYQTPGYQDRTRKQFILGLAGQAWRIEKEVSIGILR